MNVPAQKIDFNPFNTDFDNFNYLWINSNKIHCTIFAYFSQKISCPQECVHTLTDSTFTSGVAPTNNYALHVNAYLTNVGGKYFQDCLITFT